MILSASPAFCWCRSPVTYCLEHSPEQAADKAANVGKPGNTATLGSSGEHTTQDLKAEPAQQIEYGRDIPDKAPHVGLDASHWEEYHVSPHDA